MRSRILRVSAAGLLTAAAVAAVAPHATHYVSSSAMVNAPLLRVQAPFDGRVEAASPAVASPVRAGETLLRLRAERASRRALEDIEARLKVTRAETEALAAQREALSAVRADLEARVARQARAVARWLEAARRRAEAEARGAGARLARQRAELDRARRLASAGRLPEAALERARAEAEALAAEAAERRAARAVLEAEAAALAEGLPVRGGAEGGVYARQRLDELAMRLAELEARLAVLSGRRAALEAQREAARRELARRRDFAPEAATDAVVWRASPAAGTAASQGETLLELVDCRRRFVEVAVAERHFERIRAGDPATVHLRGGAGDFTARVEAVGGAGARAGRAALAARSEPPRAGDLQVLVRLSPADVSAPGVAETFCDVGRSAQVRFAREAPAPLAWLAERASRAAAAFGRGADALREAAAVLRGGREAAEDPAVAPAEGAPPAAPAGAAGGRPGPGVRLHLQPESERASAPRRERGGARGPAEAEAAAAPDGAQGPAAGRAS